MSFSIESEQTILSHPASHLICGVSFYIAIPIARIQALLQTAFRETQSGNRVVSEYIAN